MSTKASVLVRKRTMFAGLSPCIFFLAKRRGSHTFVVIFKHGMSTAGHQPQLSLSHCLSIKNSGSNPQERWNHSQNMETWQKRKISPNMEDHGRSWKIMEDMCFSLPINHHGFWGDNLGRTFSGEVVNPPTAFEWNKATRISAKTALQKPKPVRQRH